MSGIRAGSRLEQLLDLRARIDQEITQERTRTALHEPRPPQPTPEPEPAPKRPRPVQRYVDDILSDLGVTGKHIKEWGYKKGLMAPSPGRCPKWLIYAYEEAHTR